MSETEWDAAPWHTQRAYLDGLEADESVPFKFEETSELPADGPQIRTGVDPGVPVIDLAAMRAELEASRR